MLCKKEQFKFFDKKNPKFLNLENVIANNRPKIQFHKISLTSLFSFTPRVQLRSFLQAMTLKCRKGLTYGKIAEKSQKLCLKSG